MVQTGSFEAATLVVGAGIVGCSIAHHLAELGHTDVIVVDRGTVEDPLGSTGHAPGLLGRNSASPHMAALADYTADLFSRIPADSPALTRVGSVEITRDADRFALLERKVRTAQGYGFSARLVSPGELLELVPYMDVSSVLGGILVPDDGALDARRALRSLRSSAADRGVRFVENATVTGFERSDGCISGVSTSVGRFGSDNTVVAAGIWGAHLLARIGIDFPLTPVQHPYVHTLPLRFLGDTDQQAVRPLVRDLDNLFYLREHGGRLGYGWYSHDPAPVDVATIERADIPFPATGFLEHVGYELFPFLKTTPIERRINGVFSMTPDGGPLLGELPGLPGLWVAEAVWATHSGGVGKAIAEMLLGRPPSIDVSAFRPDRFEKLGKEARRRASLALYNDIYAWPDE